ncbi:MAG: hypothetical protein CBE16_12650 [Rhodospirillaceae bacterium TMED256]|nr:MAG: hypothetical protein CBE16_12650 [Rhodospirillaceae bacterium TMED256]
MLMQLIAQSKISAERRASDIHYKIRYAYFSLGFAARTRSPNCVVRKGTYGKIKSAYNLT